VQKVVVSYRFFESKICFLSLKPTSLLRFIEAIKSSLVIWKIWVINNYSKMMFMVLDQVYY
jgi:hypothetical protein